MSDHEEVEVIDDDESEVLEKERERDEDHCDEVVAVMNNKKEKRKKMFKKFCRNMSKILKRVPLFMYLLGLFVIAQLASSDVRAVVLSVGTYKLNALDIIQIIASIMCMVEMLKVSKPKQDNSTDAVLIGVTSGIYCLLFLAGNMSENILRNLFSNTEFLFLMIITFVQAIVAAMINVRTARVTISHGDHGGED